MRNQTELELFRREIEVYEEIFLQKTVKAEDKETAGAFLDIKFNLKPFTEDWEYRREVSGKSTDLLFLKQFAGIDGTYAFRFDAKAGSERSRFEELLEDYGKKEEHKVKRFSVNGAIIGATTGIVVPILFSLLERIYTPESYTPPEAVALVFQSLFGAGYFSIAGAAKAQQDLKYVKKAEEELRRDYLKEPFLLGRSDKIVDYNVLKKLTLSSR